jgi:hypothetical protein
MDADRWRGRSARLAQYTKPDWEPLLDAVGARLTETFMWMHEAQLDDGEALHAYKHVHTRRYLYLTERGAAFEPAPCGDFVPIRLDRAIEAALCPWWILAGWDAEDAAAVGDAVARACERTSEEWRGVMPECVAPCRGRGGASDGDDT